MIDLHRYQRLLKEAFESRSWTAFFKFSEILLSEDTHIEQIKDYFEELCRRDHGDTALLFMWLREKTHEDPTSVRAIWQFLQTEHCKGWGEFDLFDENRILTNQRVFLADMISSGDLRSSKIKRILCHYPWNHTVNFTIETEDGEIELESNVDAFSIEGYGLVLEWTGGTLLHEEISIDEEEFKIAFPYYAEYNPDNYDEDPFPNTPGRTERDVFYLPLSTIVEVSG
jgi:hypothetical protein